MAPAGAVQPLVALLGGEAVSLLSLKSRQSVGTLRGSRGATCAAFSADGLQLHTAGTLLARPSQVRCLMSHGHHMCGSSWYQ